jgi:hypothetical protein
MSTIVATVTAIIAATTMSKNTTGQRPPAPKTTATATTIMRDDKAVLMAITSTTAHMSGNFVSMKGAVFLFVEEYNIDGYRSWDYNRDVVGGDQVGERKSERFRTTAATITSHNHSKLGFHILGNLNLKFNIETNSFGLTITDCFLSLKEWEMNDMAYFLERERLVDEL